MKLIQMEASYVMLLRFWTRIFQTSNCNVVGTETPNTDVDSDASYFGLSESFCCEES